MPTCCLGQRQLARQHSQHDLDLSSTDTCRDGFCCLFTQPSFPTPQLNPPPERSIHSNMEEDSLPAY